MNQDAVVAGTSPPRLSLWSRVIGVLTAPRATFASVAAHPRALGVLLVIIVASCICSGWFASTDVGKRAVVDQQVAVIEGFGKPVTDEAYSSLERQSQHAAAITVGTIVAAVPAVTAVLALISFGVLGGILGGPGTFRQTFAVTAHAGVVAIVEQLFVTPINYLRESMSDPANLSVFLPMFDEGSFVTNLAGFIRFFRLWWLLTLSIGLAVLYRRRTGPIFWTLLGIYFALGLAIAGVKAFLGGA